MSVVQTSSGPVACRTVALVDLQDRGFPVAVIEEPFRFEVAGLLVVNRVPAWVGLTNPSELIRMLAR